MEGISTTIQTLLKESNWSTRSPRGLQTKELFRIEIPFNPIHPLFSTETRPFNFRYFLGEVKWFFQKNRNIDGVKPYSKFWNKIVDDQNEVNSNYGCALLGDQLKWVYDRLSTDKDTRQAISFISGHRFQYTGNKDFPCTIYLNFSVEDNKLCMMVRMRSNDIFFGATYDLPWFSLIQQNLYLQLKTIYPELQLGTYYHYADNLHFYERHYTAAESIKQESIVEQYKMELQSPFYDIESGSLTQLANDFMNEVQPDLTEEQYYNIANKYFNITKI